MAEDDIYGNKRRYEDFVKNLDKLATKSTRRKYHCKNKANLKYFKKLIRSFEVNDTSYIRRLSLLHTMKFLNYYINCDLKDVNCVNKEEIIIKCRKAFRPTNLPRKERDIRYIGRVLFDEDKIPKFFKDFKIKVDISRQKARKDKLTYEEFEKIIKFFSDDAVLQAYLSVAFETLSRPQETMFIKIKDLELFDDYAILTVSEHGKEGVKRLLCIDSFPYLIKMYKQHKDSKNNSAFLFLNEYGKQLTPFAVNKKLRNACNRLKIDKPITCYSLKRFGVTFRRLNGDDDVTIQKIAGWRSTKQLKTYDLSNQEDVFRRELAKRGMIKDKTLKHVPKTKPCQYCGEIVGFADSICNKCNHILDRNLIKEKIKKDEELMEFMDGLKFIKENNLKVFNEIRDIGLRKGIV